MTDPNVPRFQFGLKGMLLTVTVLGTITAALRMLYLDVGPVTGTIAALLIGTTLAGALAGVSQGQVDRHSAARGAILGFVVGVLLLLVLLCSLPAVR